ncbi:MAG: hypothetical protein ACREV3_07780 [Gammaproteobacteria bacterium]
MSQVVFRCTHQQCQELFVATYRGIPRNAGGRQVFVLVGTAPWATRKSTFPSTVSEISPTFVEIYDQAIAAETHGLSQLVGIGLRKALEFLVKDFASREAPEKEKEIRKARLALCISKYVSDANVQACSTRAAWLGNDETHYTRKWEDRDINDLKLLVRLTVNWMDNILLTKKYVSEMESSGKKEGA